MSLYDLALVVHVLGWVFWLGTDVGVFLGARYAERVDLSAETRLTVLELGMLLDRAPRFAVPIVWFTGVLLSHQLGVYVLSMAVAIPLAILWLLITWGVIFGEPLSSVQRAAMLGQQLFYFTVIVGMGLGGSWLLYDGTLPLWLALKWFAFVLVAVAALLLEKLFAPVIPLFQDLAVNGASDDLNTRIIASLKPVYPAVLAIYAGTLIAGVCGLTKPTF